MDDGFDDRGVLIVARDAVLAPLRPLTSKTARRAYLGSFLFISTAFTLLVLSTIAYIAFYNLYIPPRGFSLPLHLQYPDINSEAPPFHLHPYATAPLGRRVAINQGYDITVSVTLPRTEQNVAQGNFMLALNLTRSSGAAAQLAAEALGHPSLQAPDVVARAARTASLTYYSSMIDTAVALMGMPFYVTGLRTQQETLRVELFERVEFSRGGTGPPDGLALELRSDEKLQVYKVQIHFEARFRGLRWAMYKHRFISAGIFIAAFWSVSTVMALIAWAALSYVFLSAQSSGTTPKWQTTIMRQQNGRPTAIKRDEDATSSIKTESADERLSNTARTFPGYGTQPAQRYEGKKEQEDAKVKLESLPDDPAAATLPSGDAGDIDDETPETDDDAHFLPDEAEPQHLLIPTRGGGMYGATSTTHDDSGIGTSLESSNPAGLTAEQQRRMAEQMRRRGKGGSAGE